MLKKTNMRRIVSTISFVLFSLNLLAQTTYNPSVRSKNNNCTIESVSISDSYTIVTIRVPKTYWGASISNVTVLVPEGAWSIEAARRSNIDLSTFPGLGTDATINQLLIKKVQELKAAKELMSDRGWLIRNLGEDKLDQEYRIPKGSSHRDFTLYFDALPAGVESFYIRELKDNGWEWTGIQINNPRDSSLVTYYDAQSIKPIIDEQNDGITGIYEGTTIAENRYTLGCIKDGDNYKLIFLNCAESMPLWSAGEVKCMLYPSATTGLYRGDWYMSNKSKETNCYVSFNGTTMSVILKGEEEKYIKMYPSSGSGKISQGAKSSEWSGTGFALKNGYIVTNHHVVDEAKSIVVRGVNGDASIDYKASIIASDKNNDLAIIRIEDPHFTGFGPIPYSVKTQMAEVGESIWVLGYPLTQVLGNEIKLTNGIISSRSGYLGDISTYQISAPVQPGNSGGPLFDSKGNVVGIVNAGVSEADNVGYAIKVTYLASLLECFSLSSNLPNSNTIASLQLKDQVNKVDDFVFLLLCSSQPDHSF